LFEANQMEAKLCAQHGEFVFAAGSDKILGLFHTGLTFLCLLSLHQGKESKKLKG
jgi:hypothetical protein